MWVDESEIQNEDSSVDFVSLPDSPTTPELRQRKRDYAATRSMSTEAPAIRASLRNLNRLSSFMSNIRTSVHEPRLMRQWRERHSSDNVEDENLQQPRFVTEERQEDAIFKIFLKQIRKKTPSSSSSSTAIHELGDEQSEQNESKNTNRGELLYSTVKIYQLKAGTLEKIVECLTNKHGDLDSSHMHILFATYRTYTDTSTLINTILARYRAVIPASLDMTEDVRQKTLKSISMALSCLITAYKEDFYEPPNYILLNYLLQNVPNNDHALEHQCRSLLARFRRDGKNIFQTDSDTISLSNDVDNNNNKSSRSSSIAEQLYNKKSVGANSRRNFIDMSNARIAEQLTIVDANLLKRVLPYECLTMRKTNSSRRGLNSHRPLSTADKTIEHFNAVVYRVIETVLREKNEHIRARVIEKWIDIAQECQQLRNFSSLRAILNGLQDECIFRLRTDWSHVDADHQALLDKLKRLFGSCGADQNQVRAILDKQLDDIRLNLSECDEGTAKYADPASAAMSTLGRKFRLKKTPDEANTMIGTVPYLGMYLSDLSYIDAAHENYIHMDEKDPSSPKLIHFDKHRKKFEILAQIILFQSAANAYTTLQRIPSFQHWFDRIEIHTDSENWERSYQIKPKESADNVDNQRLQKSPDSTSLSSNRSQPMKAFPSQVSLESLITTIHQTPERTAPSDGSSASMTSLDKMSVASTPSFAQRQQSVNSSEKKTYLHHSRSSSASSFLTNASSSQGYISAQASPTNSVANCIVNPLQSNTLIAKVKLVGRDDLLYKKVRIGDNERVPNVLRTVLEKFGLDPSTHDRYCIEQKLPDRKIFLLDDCNVFYALARKPLDEDVDLIVREKTRQELDQARPRFQPTTGHNRTPSNLSVSSNHSR